MADVRLIDANALKEDLKNMLARVMYESDLDFDHSHAKIWTATITGIQHSIKRLDNAPTIDAVKVVRCRECKNGAPLPEEARDEFSPGVMRCLAGRGDCDKYCTTWEDGFCDEGAKMDAKDMDVPTKDGGATDGV